jgi:uncharacterized protein (TIGR02599 family)
MDTNATTINQNLTRPIADNIVALIVAPQVEVPGAGAGNQFESVFNYDSVDDTDPSPTRQGNQHRLPSLVKVILIAIDEGSADRLSQNGSPQSPPFDTLISEELEKEDAARNLNATMTNVANIMADKRVNYRIFSATVSMRGAKWGS